MVVVRPRVFEDLQRVDPSSVNLLSVVARRQPAKLLVIGTYRSNLC